MKHICENRDGLMSRVKKLLTGQPEKAHTIGDITAALDLWGAADKADISACLCKLRAAGKVTRTTVPATSTKGRREIAAYQHTNP